MAGEEGNVFQEWEVGGGLRQKIKDYL